VVVFLLGWTKLLSIEDVDEKDYRGLILVILTILMAFIILIKVVFFLGKIEIVCTKK